MHETNGDRLKWLRNRVYNLERQIIRENREDEFALYIKRASEMESVYVSDAEWKTLLPLERSERLIPYYHCLRTELMEMARLSEEPDTMGGVQDWLDSKWAKIIITTGALAEVAAFILHLIQSGGSFLSGLDHDSRDLSVWRT